MTSPGGYAPRGQRRTADVPHGDWKATTLVAGLTARGPVAPVALGGPTDGAAFVAHAGQAAAAGVRRGDLVVPDNLSGHKTAGVRAARGRCRVAYLHRPPDRPDLNPIEPAFPKRKRLARRAGERTVEGRWAAPGRLIDQFTPAGCRNDLRHAGYDAAKT